MKDISPITQPVFRRKEPTIQPDVNLFAALLNLLPDAALIVHCTLGSVYCANSAFFRLTAFSQKEISGVGINALLPALDLAQMSSGDEYTLALNRRQREAQEVAVQVSSLDPLGQWMILTLAPQDRTAMDPDHAHETMFAVMLALFQLIDAESAELALAEVTQQMQSLLQTDLVCVYQADSQFPQLKKVASCEGETPVFPELLPSTDLSELDDGILWMPGRRVMTEVERAGRVANLGYVLSIPLGQPGALVGLLVAGDRQCHLGERMLNLLHLLGSAISAVLQHLMLLRTLEQRIAFSEVRRQVWDGLVENSPVGVIVLRPDLSVGEMNQAAEWLLEYATAEVQGQPVESMLIGNDRIAPALEAAQRGIQIPSLGVIQLHRRSGAAFPANVQITPVMKDDQVLAIAVYLTDVSDQEEIRSRTSQLEQRAFIGDFTAMFAHEVRNPINNLSLGLQLMASRLEEDDPNMVTIQTMTQDCSRLTSLMEEVLTLARPLESKLAPLDIVVMLRQLTDRWRPRMVRKNIELYFKVDADTPQILGNVRSLEQVFTNLITNAIDAMGENGGTLGVIVRVNELTNGLREVQVDVSDDGPGVPQELLVKIFEPFQTRKVHGTGLGLAITRRIVNAHHGTINCESIPGGTVFILKFPAVDGENG